MDTIAWMQEVRLQDVIGRVESGTETESDAGSQSRGWTIVIKHIPEILSDVLLGLQYIRQRIS